MRKIRNWLAGAALTIAGLFGYHHTIPETSTIEIKTEVVSTPTPVPTATPLGPTARITIGCDSTCTDAERKELPAITAKVLEVEASKCFSDYLFNSKTGIDRNQTNGLPIQGVVLLVTTAKVSTKLTYYYEGRNWFTKVIVLGYENGDGMIHANRAAWNYMSLCEKASNVAHEISHGEPLNFSHDFKNTARRPYSVPYVIGDAVAKCCK